MVYSKQALKKRVSQRRIYYYILRKPNHWASFKELTKAKEIDRCRRTISKALKEMLKPDAEYPLVRAKRPFDPYGLRKDWKNWRPGMQRTGSILDDLYRGRGLFKGVLKPDAQRSLRLLRARAQRYLQPPIDLTDEETRKTFENKVCGGEPFYYKKELRKILDKYYKQFQRFGYSAMVFEIEHGRK